MNHYEIDKVATINKLVEEKTKLRERVDYLEDLTDKDAKLITKHLLEIQVLQKENKRLVDKWKKFVSIFSKDDQFWDDLINGADKLEAIRNIIEIRYAGLYPEPIKEILGVLND